MRIGSNPEKFNKEIVNKAYHRIVIPVYIPNSEGYFKDALKIFKLSIKSLLLTIHNKTAITIYNNNSCLEVKKYIDTLYQSYDEIDQVFHSKENLGKINAILAAVKGNLEPIITITDSDVFFKHDWQKEVEKIFLKFPQAGMVSPVPNSKAYKAFTSNNWYQGVIGNGRFSFEEVKEPEAMKKFEHSLGPEVRLFNDIHFKKYMILHQNGERAVMGCGHFVATLRREVFDKGTSSPAFIKIQGGVENKFIDIPNENLGYLRLSTLNNYAYHLGNITEKWMDQELELLAGRNNGNFDSNISTLKGKPLNTWQRFLGKGLRKVLLNKYFKEGFLNLLA